MLNISQIINIANARQETKYSVNVSVDKGFASDLMSDVLKVDEENLILLTGLCNLQTIRTSEMADIKIVLFVRGKKPTDEMIKLAEESGIVVLTTDYSMFKTSGMLYESGLKEVF